MKHQFRSVLLLVTISGAVAASYAMAQQEGRRSRDVFRPAATESPATTVPSGLTTAASPYWTGQVSGQNINPVDLDGNVVTGYRLATRGSSSKQAKQQKVMLDALATLKDEEASGQEQDEAQETIAKILDEQFEQDMESREQRIVKLEEQIDQLRAQIEKRKDAKDKLIRLRIELMVNESEGLGFPSTWNSTGSRRFWDRNGSSSVMGFAIPPQAPNFPGAVTVPGVPIEPVAPVGRSSAPRRSSR